MTIDVIDCESQKTNKHAQQQRKKKKTTTESDDVICFSFSQHNVQNYVQLTDNSL